MTKKNEPLVSVIIPCYNSEKWILETLNSVFEQTYNNIKIIIIDDGSTDSTREVLDEYIKDNEVEYYYQKNKGPAAARNLGIDKARGKYIAFLDSDDLWKKEKLQIQVDFLESNPEYKLVFSNVDVINEEGNFLYKNENNVPENRKELIKEFFLGNINMNTPTIIVNTFAAKKVGGFDESLVHREDHYFLMKIVDEFKIKHLDSTLVKRRVREGSLSSNLTNNIRKPELRLDYYKPFIEKATNDFCFLERYKKIQYSNIYRSVAVKYFINNNKKRGRHFIKKSLKLYSKNIKSYLLYIFSFTPFDYLKIRNILKKLFVGGKK